jgi:hypothetical protein
MIRSLLILAGCSLFFLLLSCRMSNDQPGSNTGMIPDSLISPANMALILSDIHILEAGLLLKRNESIDKREPLEKYYNGIFAKYHICRQRFNMNLEYYQNDPDEFVKIYDRVVTILETRQKQVSNR